MKLNTCITEYVEHIRYERRLAKTTVKHYQSWLRGFVLWCAENGYPDPELETFNALTLRRYMMDKSKAGARPRTIHSAFHPLIGLGTFLVEKELVTENPAKLVKLPKKDAAVRHLLADSDVQALFDACKRQRTQRQITLSRAVLSVLAFGGLRREECCDLRLEDISLEERALLVRSGKGGKSRRVFVCKDAITALREWLAVREAGCTSPYLFTIDRLRRMHHQGIATLIETIAATAGMADNEAVKPHSLRHWCATNLLKNGANIRDVQQFLGHSDLQTTCRYLHSSEEQLRTISELTALRPQTPPKEQNGSELHVRQQPSHERPRFRRATLR